MNETTALAEDTRSPLILYSVMAGLCPLIPVPFLDDMILGYVTRRMTHKLLGSYGLTPTDAQVKQLTRERSGCPLGCLHGMVLYPIKKVLKKILFFLAFKTCIEVASRWFHRGYLLAIATQRGLLTAQTLRSEAALWPLVLAIEETLIETDTSPISSIVRAVFTSSRAALRSASRQLRRLLVRLRKPSEPAIGRALDTAEAQEQEALGGVTEALADRIFAEQDYLGHLEQTLMEKLAEARDRMKLTEP